MREFEKTKIPEKLLFCSLRVGRGKVVCRLDIVLAGAGVELDGMATRCSLSDPIKASQFLEDLTLHGALHNIEAIN